MPARWSVRFEHRVPASLRLALTARLVEVAEAMEGFIAPSSDFWRTEQGLHLDFDGWLIDYRLDLHVGRVTVVGASRTGPQAR
jgi:hypothetical protein